MSHGDTHLGIAAHIDFRVPSQTERSTPRQAENHSHAQGEHGQKRYDSYDARSTDDTGHFCSSSSSLTCKIILAPNTRPSWEWPWNLSSPATILASSRLNPFAISCLIPSWYVECLPNLCQMANVSRYIIAISLGTDRYDHQAEDINCSYAAELCSWRYRATKFTVSL